MENPFKSLIKPLIILFGIIGFGISGFMLLEDYTFRNALYMTVQTVSTVGFNEVQPFHSFGKEFTVILIILSFGTFAYAISSLWQILNGGNIQNYLKFIAVEKKIEKMENHIIICGYGRNGSQAAKVVESYGEDLVVIERRTSLIPDSTQYAQNGRVIYIEGDATEDSTLENAGISRARALITTLQDDAENVFVVITARQLNPNIQITARANDESTVKKLLAAGANDCVMPSKVGGGYMAHAIIKPGVTEFINQLSKGGFSETNMEELYVNDLPASMKANTIDGLQIQKKTGCIVIGMKIKDTESIINPSLDRLLQPDSVLYVLGNPDQIKTLKNLFEVD